MNPYRIKLATLTQALLFELELKGQLSDGYWENSTPHDHWKIPCAAEVQIDWGQQGINFNPRRRYNFAAADLIKYVGERMQQYILLALKFPSLSRESLRNSDSGEWIWETKPGKEVPEWQQKFWDEMFIHCNVSNYEEMQALLASLDKTKYTMKDLKNDLKAINFAFKTTLPA